MMTGSDECQADSMEQVLLGSLVPCSSFHRLETSFCSCATYAHPSCGWPGYALGPSPPSAPPAPG